MHNHAQGTIEYLVILAVIVVIALVVVSLLFNQNQTEQINIQTGKTQNLIGKGGISIIDSIASTNGDAVISLKNISGEKISITKITPIGSSEELGTENFCDANLNPGEWKNCALTNVNSVCPCTEEQTMICNFRLTYLSAYGIEKIETFTVRNECITQVNHTETTYNVTYLGNENTTGNSPIDSNDYESGDTVFVLGNYNELERTGYTFSGWNTNSSGTGTNYSEGETFVMEPQDISLYAKWTENIAQFSCEDPLAGNYFCNGSGTEEDPYGIYDINMLQNISQRLDANYILLNDINATQTINWNWNESYYEGFNPIGDDYFSLEGNFDGNNHTIFGIFINRPTESYIGLFAKTTGNISNINLTDINITGNHYTGGLVGKAENGLIYNTHTSGNVKGNADMIGGMAGYLGNSILNSSSTTNVEGGNFVGILVGQATEGSSISNCYSNGTVIGNHYTGGLAGYTAGTVFESYSKGSLASTGNYIGGLIGYLFGTGIITNSYSTSNVNTTGQNIGGLVGGMAGTVNDSYSTGSVTSTGGLAGGLTGYKYTGSTIFDSYWFDQTGDSASHCYYNNDLNCTKINSDNGGISYFYTNTNPPMDSWDFDNNWISQENDYPILSWQSN